MKLLFDIFIFQLQKKINGKYEQDASNFDDVYKLLHSRYQDKKYICAFLQELVKSFDETFYLDKEKTKAFSFQNIENLSIELENNTISGKFIGGNTGIEYSVYNNDNATEITHIVQETEVASLPFYFLIWFPKGFNTGVLIVQKYSNQSCLSLFRQRLKEIFSDFNYKIKWTKFVPQEIRDNFLKDSMITEIDISWKSDIDNELKPQVNLLQNGNIVSKIKGFGISLSKFLSDIKYQKAIMDEIPEFYPGFNEVKHKLKFFYVNEKGDTAQSTIDDLNNLIPSIHLGKICLNFDNTPNWDEINNQAHKFLDFIKTDLKYSLKEQ